MSAAPHSPESAPAEYDPVFLHSRKEAIVIFCVWLVGLLWAVPYCYLNGYIDDFDPQSLNMIWGIPSWMFWGIAVPWLAADLFTAWFCFSFMAEDELGEAHEGADIKEENAERHANDQTPKEET